MNKRITLESAYLLHRRAYRETSFLVELWTLNHGRLSAVARGARKARMLSGLLQPFSPLLVSWSGKSDLVTLTHTEPQAIMHPLRGENLFAGLYLNELLMTFMQRWDAHSRLFHQYDATIQRLQGASLCPSILRSFEKNLLEEMGYAFLPKTHAEAVFVKNCYYRFIPEQGFVSEMDQKEGTRATFLGEHLLAIAQENWYSEAILSDAKRLIRIVMQPLLGTKVLRSRELFSYRNVYREGSDK